MRNQRKNFMERRRTKDKMTGNRKVIKNKKHNYDKNRKSGTEWNIQDIHVTRV